MQFINKDKLDIIKEAIEGYVEGVAVNLHEKGIEVSEGDLPLSVLGVNTSMNLVESGSLGQNLNMSIVLTVAHPIISKLIPDSVKKFKKLEKNVDRKVELLKTIDPTITGCDYLTWYSHTTATGDAREIAEKVNDALMKLYPLDDWLEMYLIERCLYQVFIDYLLTKSVTTEDIDVEFLVSDKNKHIKVCKIRNKNSLYDDNSINTGLQEFGDKSLLDGLKEIRSAWYNKRLPKL